MRPYISTDEPVPDVNEERMEWDFLAELEVGHSAHFDVGDPEELVRIRNNLASAANRYAHTLNRRFTVRVRKDRTGVGVWRVK